MNFKAWKIKVDFHNTYYELAIDEKQDKILMEETLNFLVNECDYMPRVGDIIGDIENDSDPFVVVEIALATSVKTIYFTLSLDAED